MLTFGPTGGRNMYVPYQLYLKFFTKRHKSLPKALLQRNSLKWVSLAPSVTLKGTNVDVSQDETVRHVETTLARSLFNCDEL